MKFFTYEMWSKLSQDISEDEFEEIDKKWIDNLKEYQEIFESLSNRLPQNIFNHFNSWGFQDYRLVKLELEHDEFGVPHPLQVHFTITNDASDGKQYEIWKLTFNNVSVFNVEHTTDDDEFSIHRGFDDWGYNEFLPVNKLILSFEVLFATGTSILIHFPNNSVSLKKLN